MSRVAIVLPPRPAAEAGVQAQGATPLRAAIEFADDAGALVGEPVPVAWPEAVIVEGRGPSLTPSWEVADPAEPVEVEAPTGAAALRIRTDAGAGPLLPLVAAAGAEPRAPDARRRFPPEGARWMLTAVAERYTDAEFFFAQAAELQQFIAGEAPFDEAGVSLGVDALFWASPEGGSLFDATDDRIQNRVLTGNNARVTAFVAAAGGQARKVLVIVNSRERAGAGGAGSERPSWITTAADPSERWEAVALHELGHAFGLADEYDSAAAVPEPHPLEPNVSDQPDPAQTACRDLCTAGAPPSPTCRRGEEAGTAPGTIGTFQGARYHPDDRYRPTQNCRMRTTTFPFCPVCQAQIRAVLAA